MKPKEHQARGCSHQAQHSPPSEPVCAQLFNYQYAAKFSRAYEDLRAGSTCWFPSPREAPGPSTRADDAGGLARGGVGELSIGQSWNLEVEIDAVEPRILAPPKERYAEQVIECPVSPFLTESACPPTCDT